MARKKVLFVCGSMNQTTMMHKISKQLPDYDHAFTPFFCDGAYKGFQKLGWLDWTIVGGQNRRGTEAYFAAQKLPVDYAGSHGNYDLMLTCTDLIVPKRVLRQPLILVQEGMTDPENFMFHVVRYTHKVGVPRWLASTSTTGLSDAYTRFCVASDGYRRHFERKGVKPEKLVVTGIPNFDNVQEYLDNDFPHKNYVLVATTDTRENFKWDNRKKFIQKAREIANGRLLIFKLHPNEAFERSAAEIEKYAPGSLVFQKGNTNHMIANCDVLITQFSSVVYVGMALGKQVFSYFDMDELRELLPLQNGGASASNIAGVARELLGDQIGH